MSNDGTKDRERAFWRAYHSGQEPEWQDIFPSESKGNGQVAKNNKRTGAAQGRSSLVRKAKCRLCGFPNDLSRVDHSGGSLDGNGAGGDVNTSIQTSVTASGVTHTEAVGEQAYRNNSGCALCFTKNNTLIRTDVTAENDPWSRISPLGF